VSERGFVRGKKLRRWTVQPGEVHQALLEQGELLGRMPEFSWSERRVREAYEWLRKRLAARLGVPELAWVWWAWLTPPSRAPGYLRLELSLDERECVLLDYYGWHCVLNQEYLPLTRAEDRRWEVELRRRGAAYPMPLPQDLAAKRDASWERVFDLEALRNSELWSGEVVQVCFPVLRLRDVVATAGHQQARVEDWDQ
jgi:hypothetical protein